MKNNKQLSDYSNFIATSRYARWLEEENRREMWDETVTRYTDFMRERTPESLQNKIKDVHKGILNLELAPSMRALMTSGPALERCNVAGFNCAYLPVDSLRSFDETMYILLCGTGVGFSVERQYTDKLPSVNEHFEESGTVISVADSKAGWARALRELIALLFSGQIPKWDTSKVRPAGARLKTFGGRASGPEPLIDLFNFVIRVITSAAGRKLRPIECHDLICKIAEVVVVGGVRRSALISLSDLEDSEMAKAKAGQWWESHPHRALANNSAVYDGKPSVGKFMSEWTSIYESKSGERGIFNREAVTRQAARNGRRVVEGHIFGTNPCVTGETFLLTKKGHVPIRDVVGEEVEAWNGEEWSPVVPFSTGVNPIMRVELSDGTSIECTPYHKWLTWTGWNRGGKEERKETQQLKAGDKLSKYGLPSSVAWNTTSQDDVNFYSQGFYSGDGNKNRNFSWIYADKHKCVPRLKGEVKGHIEEIDRSRWVHGRMKDKDFVPSAKVGHSVSDRLSWLAGLIDSDGCKVSYSNSDSLQIGSIDFNFLSDVKLMLSTLGVNAKINKMKDAGVSDIKGIEYNTQSVYRILITCSDTQHLLSLGLKLERVNIRKGEVQRDARRFVTVVSVEDLQYEEETFCVTDEIAGRATFNGVVTGNCSEIILREFEFCNLSEVVVRKDDTQKTLKRKLDLAVFLGTYQSTLTDFKYLRKIWANNCNEERLLGVSLTGNFDNRPLIEGKIDLVALKKYAVERNKVYAEAFGIPQSVAVTCVKPSGTVSQLVDAASGLHPRHSAFYRRTIRGDNKDPMTQFLKDSGVEFEPCVMQPNNTTVFSFYVEAPKGSLTRDDITAEDHLNVWMRYQEDWCEHKPSVTVNVRENEWPKLGGLVYDNFDVMTGIALLPHSDHVYAQAPYQEITEEEYNNAPKYDIDWNKLREYELEDTTTGSQELACTGGVCEIADIGA